MEEELIGQFRTKKEIYREEVEDWLLDYLEDEFSTVADDDSAKEISALLVEMYQRCGRMDLSLVENVIAREPKVAAVTQSVKPQSIDPDDESDSEDEEGGNNMTNSDDGWQTILRKNKTGKRR